MRTIQKANGENPMTFCTDCGGAIPDGAKFCGACGRAVALPAALPPLPESMPRVNISPTPQSEKERSGPTVSPVMVRAEATDMPIWIAVGVGLGILVVHTFIAAYVDAAPLGSAVAEAFGASLVPIVIGGLIGFFAGRSAKSKRPVAGFIYGTVIVFALELVGSYDYQRKRYEERRQAANAVVAIKEDVNRAFAAPSSAAPNVPPVQPVPGELGEIQKFLRSTIEQFQFLQRNYQKELRDTGWSTVLDPGRISKDVGLRDSKRIVAEAKQIVDKYARKSQSGMEGLEAQLLALPVSANTRDQAIAGFRQSMGNNNHMAELWELEARIVQAVGDIFALLETSGEWQVLDGKVVFTDDAQLRRFNADLAAIERLSKQQVALRQDAQARTRESLNSLQ